MEAAKETYPEFAPISKEGYERRFKGLNDVNVSEKKSYETWRREGGIYKGQWVEPEIYTLQNLPSWCYETNWTNERRCCWMNNRIQRKKEKKEAEQKNLKREKRFRTLRLKIVDEMRRKDYVGNPADEQGTLNDIL